MTRVAATINAFAVAAIVPPVAFIILGAARGDDIRDAPFWVLVFLPYSIMATVLIAAPLFLIIARLGRVNLWSTLAGGLLVGAVVAVVMKLPGGWPSLSDLITMSLVGLVAAISFWVTKSLLESRSAQKATVERAL